MVGSQKHFETTQPKKSPPFLQVSLKATAPKLASEQVWSSYGRLRP